MNDTERAMTQKAIAKFGEEIEYLQFKVRQQNLMLETGHKQDYELRMAQSRCEVRQHNDTIMELQHQIIKLKDQLERGVEKK